MPRPHRRPASPDYLQSSVRRAHRWFCARLGWTAVARYFGEGDTALDANGYFDTGDVATIDPDGFMTITDRAKDLVKSGGEWISSQEIERHALSHPAVALAAVIGVPHHKWGDRPRLIVQ